jgi:glycosyltransferase involved in cell wall biosynthesis
MRILLLARYGRLGASSRLRSYQYIEGLRRRGLEVEVSPFFSDEYLRILYSGHTSRREVIKAYAQRLRRVMQLSGFDLIWIEKEILPYWPAVFELILRLRSIPYVVDYDDAVFHRYEFHRSPAVRATLRRKIDRVMHYSSVVIVGNDYLRQRAAKAGARRIFEIPTVLDERRYAARDTKVHTRLVIGWIGTPKTVRYLLALRSVLYDLTTELQAKVVAVGVTDDDVHGTSIEACRWSEDTEVDSISGFDVGIMPLPDAPWERGKCGYKLLQYMACGLPVVASPVGVNAAIVQHGVNGFLATSHDEWTKYLSLLLGSSALRRQLGARGRSLFEKEFTLERQIPRLEAALRAGRRR